MSNAERQRLFRERHPGYNRRYKYKGPSSEVIRAEMAKLKAAAEFVTAIMAPPPLMLPAPVEVIVIPGVNAIGAMPVRERVPLAPVAD